MSYFAVIREAEAAWSDGGIAAQPGVDDHAGFMNALAIGVSCRYLFFACERLRDLDRAAQWCQRLATISADQNVRALRAVCRAHYGSVLMLRGEWEQAEVELTDAAAVLADTHARWRTRSRASANCVGGRDAAMRR